MIESVRVRGHWQMLSLLLPLLLVPYGCQGYTRSTAVIRTSMAQGEPNQALNQINKRLGTSDASSIPSTLSGNHILYLLERATILQSLENYELSARDLMESDSRLEYLDLTSANSLELGKYLYSERATTYRAPAYERLMLNTLNMINFLARNQYEKARVEARRFALLEEFFLNKDEQTIHRHILALGNYLAGISFEREENFSEASRYYGRAYHFGFQTDLLQKRLIALFHLSGYTPSELQSENPDALKEITSKANRSSTTVQAYRDKYLSGGDSLIVLQVGMVPYRDQTQIPIDRALTIAQGSRYSHHQLSASQTSKFRTVSVRHGFQHIPFIQLTQGGVPQTRPTQLSFRSQSIDRVTSFPGIDLGQQVEDSWHQRRGALMVAAITRFLTRLVAAGVAGHQVKRSTGSSGLGFLTGIITYLTLKAIDQPDTRSWMTLPGEIQLFRGKLSPGSERITVNVGPRSEERSVSISNSELNLFNFSQLR